MPELFALSIIILLFSVIIHEVMHGFAALKFGDHTAQRAGRLTLNPIPHIDLVGTIIMPLIAFWFGGIIFGWAKPVPVNPLNFSNLKKGELFVSAAGILANFGLAITAAVIFHILNASPQTSSPLVRSLLNFTIQINLLLGIFNLIPIPPLDGSRILMSQLPYNLTRQYQKIEPYGFPILLILFLSGLLGFVFGLAKAITAFMITFPL